MSSPGNGMAPVSVDVDDGRITHEPIRTPSQTSTPTPKQAPLSLRIPSATKGPEPVGSPKGTVSSDVPSVSNITLNHPYPPQKKIGHRKVKMGMIIFKGHPSWNLMLNIQLGIRSSVGRITPEPERELWKDDFRVKVKLNFPRQGTQFTPAHDADDFKFADYAPFAFRHLREKFGIDAADYMLSLCGSDALRELSTPGKSGAVFYISNDDNYIIKTVSKKECHFLRSILQDYYMHIMQTPDTLLPRFFGLHRVKTQKGRNIRIVVMNNILPSKYTIHERYDLKGSTFGRSASAKERKDPNCTLKDLDWQMNLVLDDVTKQMFKKQLAADARFLQNLHIMDYSLLVGLHYKNREDDDRRLSSTSMFKIEHVAEHDTSHHHVEHEHKPSYRSQFQKDDGGMVVEANQEPALLFLGIIDILQIYDIRKKTEHQYKAMFYDENTISVVQPSFYARRFNDFVVRCITGEAPSTNSRGKQGL
eukprot:TRINITY_DN2267_c0_g1::TRINITY_DN2267_c0_g1_i1::g.6777::m.6777 TRINITY_DN2267_c0_g1::TRINITY_DN2267_c0_g1_i1::g.6777  ORF type:complete len:498 (+),score=115.43,sp/Q55GN6/Y7588_DICDI/42.69/1e-100,PIP5K/PF01504.13/5.5e-79,LSM/PF01423.17/0.011 TRINITY_DN2267_c0_g1_i1:67-1494(+)